MRDKEKVVAVGETCSRLGEMREESVLGFREGKLQEATPALPRT